MLNVSSSKYQVTFYPGNTQGVVLFALFLIDDYYMDSDSGIAKLYIDNIEVPGGTIFI